MRLLLSICLLLASTYSLSQDTEDTVATYPDLKNPKIIALQKMLSAEQPDLAAVVQQSEEILNGTNMQDKIHLTTFELADPRWRIIDWMSLAETMDQVYKAIMNLPESDYKTFATALLMNRVAQATYREPENKTKVLNHSFHAFLSLAYRGDVRSIIPLSWAASELHSLGFEDEHLTEEIIMMVYLDHYRILDDKKTLINYLRKGLYYENTFGVELTEEEKSTYKRKEDLVAKILSEYLTEFPEDAESIIYSLWTDALVEWSFVKYRVYYEPETGKRLSQFVHRMKDHPKIDYKALQKTDFLFRYFLDAKSGLNLSDFIAMFPSREESFQALIAFFEKVSQEEHLPVDILSVHPKWVGTFSKEFHADVSRYFPYAVRYSEEFNPVLAKKQIPIAAIKKSIEKYDTFEDAASEPGATSTNTLLTVYHYFDFMKEVMKLNAYKKDAELKWALAKMALDFEYYYLRAKRVHSGTIIGIDDYFDNWTPEEIKTYQGYVGYRLNRYLEEFNKTAPSTMEAGLVHDVVKKIAVQFDLL